MNNEDKIRDKLYVIFQRVELRMLLPRAASNQAISVIKELLNDSGSINVSKFELSDYLEDNDVLREYIKSVFNDGTDEEIMRLVNRITIK